MGKNPQDILQITQDHWFKTQEQGSSNMQIYNLTKHND